MDSRGDSRGDQAMHHARVLDTLLADPAALLAADRSAVRDELSARQRGSKAAEQGRSAFRQAETIFGTADVPRAEFAAWLHFAATVLGHGEYAAGVAAAAPGMPWSTEWAWWRPAGHYVAEPNLSGDAGAAQMIHRGRELIKVDGLWCDNRWFDAHTGESVPAPPADEVQRHGPGRDAEDALPALFDTDPAAPALSVPPTWEYTAPLDAGGRYLLQDEHGVAVLRLNPDVLADWPTGGASYESAEDGGPGLPLDGSPDLDPPLTAARMRAAFGAGGGVRRFPEQDLPAALEHGPSRTFLAEVGVPGWWAGGVSSFSPFAEVEPLEGDPDLLGFGYLDLGDGEDREVCVHRTTGVVHLAAPEDDEDDEDGGDGSAVYLSRDVETFTLFLENLRRYMNAIWDPYPDESGAEFEYESRMQALDPEAFADDAPAREVWEQVFATITALTVYGY
ncbi:SUKH-4 family immunity protein [Streptomyces sp. NPDC021093]|uniref:SUKH-4 family immunity protein n=1 Tax=Streptomyces sp. NPDC021093 TaxID=3365112 RepID=UPI0037A1CAEE